MSYGQIPPIKVDAFRPRTCVKFHVENLEENGYSEITYEADPIQFRDRIIYSKKSVDLIVVSTIIMILINYMVLIGICRSQITV